MAVFTRLLRSDMITTLQSDFVLSARAKGMPTGYVLRRHALRPSSVSLLTLAGVSLGRLIGGTVIVEALFSLPGMGRLIVEAISTRNYTMVQGAVLVLVAINVGVNALVDGLYGVIDPRIRRGRA
jgi:peptide/nickel transport system permease protein